MDPTGQSSGLIGLIADADTATGLLLCGIGQQDMKKNTNFLIVTEKPPTSLTEIEDKFRSLTNRDDISVVLITQSIASQIRHLIERHDKPIPAVLEIPSKTCPVRCRVAHRQPRLPTSHLTIRIPHGVAVRSFARQYPVPRQALHRRRIVVDTEMTKNAAQIWATLESKGPKVK